MHQPGETKARGSGSAPSGDWRHDAACRGLAHRYFDPWDADERAEQPNATATQFCETCPVKRECLIAAIENDEESGVWGGLTRRQRKMLVRARKRVCCPICKGGLLSDTAAEYMQVCLSCGITWRTQRVVS